MDSVSDISILGNIDKKEVPPIHQKRIVAFVNHFVIQTVTFLNKFIVNCETKFIDFDTKLHKIEASLLILEAKLSSISGIDDNTIKQNQSEIPISTSSSSFVIPPPSNDVNSMSTENLVDPTDISMPDNGGGSGDSNDLVNGLKACEDFRYKKYFKMIQFGVQVEAVKMKMISEGVDSSILDEPNKILVDGMSQPPDD